MLTLAAAGAVLLYEATKQWFYYDEWDFLAYRGVRLTGTGTLFDPHNEHWTTIPILIWRGLFDLVGIRHYWLYALPMIVAHLAVVTLLWRLMLRHHVDPWVATLLVAAFAVLGVGSENLARAFQITFVGSVAFGLLAIDAVERDKRRLPALWGVCALMCSNIGVPMVVGCVLVAIVRRRFSAAVVAGAIPALAFVIWYVSIGHIGTYASTDIASLSFNGLVSYVWTGLTTSMGGFLDSSPHLGAVIVSVLAGAAVARRNVPAALALTTVVLYVFVGFGRLQYGVGQATASRYSYIAVALCLPLMGQLVTLLVRHRDLRPIVVSGLVVLIGANAVVLDTSANAVAGSATTWSNQIRAAAYLIHAGYTFPGQLTTSSLYGPPDQPSAAVLATLIRRGQLPVPTTVDRGALRAERAILGVFSSRAPGYPRPLAFARPGAPTCSTSNVHRPVAIVLSASGSLRFSIPHPSTYVALTVSFPPTADTPSTSVVVQAVPKEHWLNVEAGAYPTALITASTAVRLCQTSASTGR